VIAEAHAAGSKLYVVSNILPHNAKVRTYLADMAPVIALAAGRADHGRPRADRPGSRNLAGHAGAPLGAGQHGELRCRAFLAEAGHRAHHPLARTVADEVEEIRQQCPDIELEVFVHGALCIAYSGRCLLSGYFNHRDPNQGTCTNSCRWDYKACTPGGQCDGRSAPSPVRGRGAGGGEWLLEEKERPGELMPIDEDEHGTYIMNSKDLRAVEHVRRLTEIGVDSLKIEGRTKSPYYVARTTQVYRRAIDDAVPAALSTPPARRTRRPGQPRLHRRLLPAPPRARHAELPAWPLGVGAQSLRRRSCSTWDAVAQLA
jgi:putative protease